MILLLMALLAADVEPYVLNVRVGKTVAICKTGTIQCPAADARCDDSSVAVPDADEKEGIVFKGVGPGKTLCSAASSSGMGYRRLYKVVVSKE